jgi:hypothetical protein
MRMGGQGPGWFQKAEPECWIVLRALTCKKIDRQNTTIETDKDQEVRRQQVLKGKATATGGSRRDERVSWQPKQCGCVTAAQANMACSRREPRCTRSGTEGRAAHGPMEGGGMCWEENLSMSMSIDKGMSISCTRRTGGCMFGA